MNQKEIFNGVLYQLPSSRKEVLEKLTIPATPAGNEVKILAIGDTFKASEIAPYRGEFVVTEIYRENGFYRYVARPVGKIKKNAQPLIFRNKDVFDHEYLSECRKAGEELFKEFGGDLLRGMRKGKRK